MHQASPFGLTKGGVWSTFSRFLLPPFHSLPPPSFPLSPTLVPPSSPSHLSVALSLAPRFPPTTPYLRPPHPPSLSPQPLPPPSLPRAISRSLALFLHSTHTPAPEEKYMHIYTVSSLHRSEGDPLSISISISVNPPLGLVPFLAPPLPVPSLHPPFSPLSNRVSGCVYTHTHVYYI